MAIERTYYCDNPTCMDDKPGDGTPCHVRSATPPPYIPGGFVQTYEYPNGPAVKHFCGWDCLLKYAATIEPPIIITMDDMLGGNDG